MGEGRRREREERRGEETRGVQGKVEKAKVGMIRIEQSGKQCRVY